MAVLLGVSGTARSTQYRVIPLGPWPCVGAVWVTSDCPAEPCKGAIRRTADPRVHPLTPRGRYSRCTVVSGLLNKQSRDSFFVRRCALSTALLSSTYTYVYLFFFSFLSFFLSFFFSQLFDVGLHYRTPGYETRVYTQRDSGSIYTIDIKSRSSALHKTDEISMTLTADA